MVKATKRKKPAAKKPDASTARLLDERRGLERNYRLARENDKLARRLIQLVARSDRSLRELAQFIAERDGDAIGIDADRVPPGRLSETVDVPRAV